MNTTEKTDKAETLAPALAVVEDAPPLAKKVKGWSPLGALLIGVLIFAVAEILAGIIISVYPLLNHWPTARIHDWLSSVYPQFIYSVLAEGLLAVGLIMAMRARSMTMASIGWRRFRLMHVVYALIGIGVYYVLFGVLLALSSSLVPNLDVNKQQDIGFNQVTGFVQLSMTFISLVVLPPLAEEWLFRGFLFTNFRRRFRLWPALLLTSLLFALPHLLEADSGLLWVGAIDTFVLSAVLCILREKTGTLWSGVVVHAIKNGIAFAALYIFHVH